MKKKSLILLSILSLIFIMFSCDEDDPEPVDLAAPTLSASTASLNMDAGQTEDVTLTLSAEAGVAQFAIDNSNDDAVGITVSGEPAIDATSASVTIAIEAKAIGSSTITVSVQDNEQEVVEVSVAVTVVAGWDYPFASAYEILELRPELSETKFLIDQAGQADLYKDLTVEGGIGAETFFFFADGWLDKFITNSPFIESREAMTPGQINMLAGMFRLQQRDNDATDPVYRNNLVWESLTSPDDANVDLGTTMNVRNRGIIGNGNFQTLIRPLALIGDVDNAQIGTYPFSSDFDITTATPTATASALAINIKVQPTPVEGQTDPIPYGIVHVFDGFPADIDAAFSDPAGYVESVMTRSGGDFGGRNYRDVSIIQNLMLADPDVKWTMNAVDPSVGAYAGSAGLYGAVIVPATSYADLDAIIRGIDASFAFGEERDRSGTRSRESVWFWDDGAGHVPEAVYKAAGDYWLKHWINTEEIEGGALADGDHTNALGESLSLTGTTITLGDATVNVLQRVRYRALRTGRWGNTPEGTTASTEFQEAVDAQGFKWVEVILVDGSL